MQRLAYTILLTGISFYCAISQTKSPEWSTASVLADDFGRLAIGNQVHIVGHSGGNLIHRTSTDNGVTWSSPSIIDAAYNNYPAMYGGLFAQGDTVYLLTSTGGDMASAPRQMDFRRSDDNGKTWSKKVRVTGSGEECYRARIVASGKYVHIVGNGNAPSGGSSLYFRSTDGGATWISKYIADNLGPYGGSQTVAVDKNTVHVVYLYKDPATWVKGGGGVTNYVKSTDNGATWSNPVVIGENSTESDLQSRNQVVAKNGRVFVVWQREPDPGSPVLPDRLGYNRSNDGGQTWLGAKILPEDNGINRNHQQVWMDNGGGVHLCWRHGSGGPDATGYMYSPDYGATWNKREIAISTNEQNHPFSLVANNQAAHALSGPRGSMKYAYRKLKSVPKLDAGVTKIIKPDTSIECLKSITPRIVLKNHGNVVLTSATIKYRVNNNTALSTPWTGSLAPGATEALNLPSISVNSGNHTFFAWSENPNGGTDVNTSNDQSSKGFAFTIADAGPDKNQCPGGTVQLGARPPASACGDPFTYSWSPTTGLSCTTCANPDASPSVNTTYTLTVTNSDNQTATDKVKVTIGNNMTVDAGVDVKICAGSSTTIGGSPSATGCGSPFKYSWSPVAGLSCTNCANPDASPSSTTTYSLTVTDANNNSSTDQVVVTVDSQTELGYWKFDENSGTSVADASGNNRNGTLVNNPQWVQGISGGALQFNGSTGHVAVADFNPPQNLTIEAWIYPTGGNGTDRIVVDKSNDEYGLRINSNGNLAAGVSKTFLKDLSFSFDNAANQNKWYQLVYVFDNVNNVHSLYRNGVKIATEAINADITNTSFPLWIGRHSQFDFGTFNGVIDEVHLYACPLSDNDVKNLYQQKVCNYKTDYSYTAKDLTATFTDNSTGAISWLWDFGDGKTGTVQNPVYVYSAKGTYKVCLTITASCSMDKVCKDITVTEACKATADFIYTSDKLTVDLTDNSQNATSWEWDMDDGSSYNIQSPAHTYASQGTYNVCLMISGSCGKDTVCKSIVVKSTEIKDSGDHELISIYPNPTSGSLFIQLPVEQAPYIEIFNLRGQLVWDQEQALNKVSDNLLLAEIEGLSTGIYYIHVRTETYLHVMKVIIRAE